MTKPSKDSDLVPLLPSREISFREKGKRTWQRKTFTILGKKTYLEKARSSKPVQLTLETDVQGFRFVEVVGIDLYLGIASALLSIESIILQLRHFGDVRLPHEEAFDVETDTVFFSSRVQDLRESLVLKNE